MSQSSWPGGAAWPSVSAWPTASSWPGSVVPFPATLTPLVRFDATQQGYTDLARSTPATAPLGRVRSIASPSPLTGNWTANTDPERPTLSAVGTLAFEPIAPDYPTHTVQALYGPSGNGAVVTSNSCTIALSFRPFKLNNGPRNVLFFSGVIGVELGGSGIGIRYSGGLWNPNFTLGKDLGINNDGDSGEGNLTCMVVRYSATGIDIYVDEAGTVHTDSFVGTQPLVATGDFNVGFAGGNTGSNAMVMQAAVTTPASAADRLALVAWLKSLGGAPMFPPSQRFIGFIADSLGVPFSADTPSGFAYHMLASVRATYPDTQMLNTAISGAGISTITGNNSTQFKTVVNRLSGARGSRQVAILQEGTNTIVGCLNSNAATQNAAIDAGVATQFALADALRSAGAKVLIATVADRTGLLGGGTQAQMDSGRARWNAAIVASGLSHCDGLVRIDSIAGLGNTGDSTSATYFVGDGVHFSDAGHALAEPAYTTAVLPFMV